MRPVGSTCGSTTMLGSRRLNAAPGGPLSTTGGAMVKVRDSQASIWKSAGRRKVSPAGTPGKVTEGGAAGGGATRGSSWMYPAG